MTSLPKIQPLLENFCIYPSVPSFYSPNLFGIKVYLLLQVYQVLVIFAVFQKL